MSILIEVRLDDNVVVCCDERCYHAPHFDCDCICQGQNHQQGFTAAFNRTLLMGRLWIADWCTLRPGCVFTFRIHPDLGIAGFS